MAALHFNAEIALVFFRSNVEESASVKSTMSVKDPDLVETEGKSVYISENYEACCLIICLKLHRY